MVKSGLLILVLLVAIQNADSFTCTKKKQLSHGYIDYETLDEGKGQAEVKCQSGYGAKPHSTITCLADGTWSDVECKIKDCKNETTIKNGKVEYKSTTYMSFATVKCNTGYKLTGHPHLVCQADGKWTTNTTCDLRDCGKHYNITNGFVEFKGKTTTYGNKFDIKCDSGYELKGDKKTECQGDGTWSKASVCQPIDCGTDYFLPNGYVQFHDKKTTYKSTVKVGCNAGYNRKGDDLITCTVNGTWTNETTCHIKQCPSDYSIAHSFANFTGRKTNFGTVIPVRCESGYKVSGEHYAICQKDAKWSSTKCVMKDCGKKYTLENGNVDFTKRTTTFKSTVPVKCNDGYKVHGDEHITCLSSGKWSVKTLCVRVNCGTVYKIDNGYVDFAGKDTTYDKKVEVDCDDGYEHDGDSEIKCGKDGKWSSTKCSTGVFGKNSALVWGLIGAGAFLLIVIIIIVVLKFNRMLCFA